MKELDALEAFIKSVIKLELNRHTVETTDVIIKDLCVYMDTKQALIKLIKENECK